MLGVPSPTIPLPPGLELAGRYRLGALVRGLGNSYLAHDVVRDCAVVVKLLGAMPFDVDLGRVEQAVAPLRALDATWLPRPLQLCDAHLQDRHCVFLVQERLEGETLEERLLRTGPMQPSEARALARRLLELLCTLAGHEPPLVHGDIHPGNLLLLPGGGVALVDWGAVKAAARDWSGDAYGPEGWTQAVNREFVAPEVPMGQGNPRSDLYGAGACLAYALTGLAPEAIRDKDPRRLLSRGLEQAHVPRSLAAVLVPLLEATMERRLDSPQAALELLMDPLAGRRGGFTVRREGEPVDWHMEPRPRLGALWSGLGVALASLLALPLLGAACAVVLPVAFGMAGWVIALRLGLGLGLGLAGLVVLRAGVRAFSPMGRLRLEGMGRALRYRHGRQPWVEIPWLQIGRVRRRGPLLGIDGAWCVPPAILPRRRTLWVAPVHEDGLDRLAARIGAHQARARALLSGSMRPGERRWPGARRPPVSMAVPAGLVLLVAVLLTGRWGGDEPATDGGVIDGPRLALEDRAVAAPHGATGAQGLEARVALSRLATMRPATSPEEARTMAIAAAALYGADLDALPPQEPELVGFQGALAELRGEPVALAGGAEPPEGEPGSRPRPATEHPLDFSRALPPLAEDPEASPDAPPSQATEPPVEPATLGTLPHRCPGALEPRVLAPGALMEPACWDEHGTMVWVSDEGSRRGFLVDWTEVSVADYARCVTDGACEAPGRHPGCYGTELARGSYPVNCVDRAQAEAWCSWAGRRLCSQAEHERAASGPGDGVYPWGDAPPACARVIMDARGQQGPAGAPGCGRGGPWPVGSRPAGVSACGALDMSGNLAEWVTGEPGGVTGGGYLDKAPEELQRGALRPLPADLPVPDVGFRCCLDGR